MTNTERQMRSFAGLRKLVATLRGPDGCPWDRAQTHQSLRHHMTEEASEAIDAIDAGDADALKEELGDLLLQILLHTQIAEEGREFRLGDVIESLAQKLVRRHPHIFSGAVAETPAAVIEQWEDLKRKERNGASALTGVPSALPALAHAQTVQRRAGKAGFEWESKEQAWAALDEELAELRAAKTPEQRHSETGDAIFALANVARFLDVEAEEALRSTSRRFGRLFRSVEDVATEEAVDLRETDFETKLAMWEEAKKRSLKQKA
ncbi:MAG TPA: nucleoside triphosphate pyrophosphohydrolase [Dehalococcoidia bacterium]